MTREEFVARAADAILRYGGEDPEACPADATVEAVCMAEAAIEAVGAWQTYEALAGVPGIGRDAWKAWDSDDDSRTGKIIIALAGGSRGYRSDTDAIHSAIAKAEGRQ
jgi:hypothetical protein